MRPGSERRLVGYFSAELLRFSMSFVPIIAPKDRRER